MTISPSYWKCRSNKKVKKINPGKIGRSNILVNILAARNIISEDEIISFLNPSLKKLHDPSMLPGIKRGISRLKKAIYGKERILIFGDYDADGIISAVLMYNFLKELGLDAEVHIPDRFSEGYDLGLKFFKKISAEKKHSLVICVDCGTNSLDVQEFSCSNPCPDVIVCDHHNQSIKFNGNPNNYIIINPRTKNSKYPFKNLSGAGVTFKFIIGILRELEETFKSKFKKNYLTSLLDLVAISIISDLMPLLDENRVMVKKGLEIIKKTVNSGLKEMINNVMADKKNISEYDIGFIIAPRLNAAGRIKSSKSSVELLSIGKDNKKEIIEELNNLNEERQNIQKDILDEIIKNNDFKKIVEENRIFIDKSKTWNEGVLGIVASNIVKMFNIPAILFKEFKGKLKGSGRSIDKFDLYGNLVSVKGLFENFGGHRTACGIRMEETNFKSFCKKMKLLAGDKIKKSDVKKKFYYDAEVNFKDINEKILKEFDLLRPFGIKNPEPVFKTGDCIIQDFRYTSGEKHIKLKLKNNERLLDAVFFRIDNEKKEKVAVGEKINILYKVRQNIWNGLKSIQLVIVDLF